MHDDLGAHQFLLPAELSSFVGRAVRPIGLFWDFGRLREYGDDETGSSIFPPLALDRWDDLRIPLPGDVLLDASVLDPRFARRGMTSGRSETGAGAA